MCGYIFTALTPEAIKAAQTQQQPKSSLWMAVLPALITLTLATCFIAYQAGQFEKVSAAIIPAGAAKTTALDCIDTYGFTLHTSEFFVREGIAGLNRQKNAPRELSTVLRGMARNKCGKPLPNLKIRIKVSDEAGNRGSAWAEIGPIAVGQSIPFERAWMGRVTNYEIAEIR